MDFPPGVHQHVSGSALSYSATFRGPPYTQLKQWIPHGASRIPEMLSACTLHVCGCRQAVWSQNTTTGPRAFEIGWSVPFSFQTMELRPMTAHLFSQVTPDKWKPSCPSALKSHTSHSLPCCPHREAGAGRADPGACAGGAGDTVPPEHGAGH